MAEGLVVKLLLVKLAEVASLAAVSYRVLQAGRVKDWSGG